MPPWKRKNIDPNHQFWGSMLNFRGLPGMYKYNTLKIMGSDRLSFFNWCRKFQSHISKYLQALFPFATPKTRIFSFPKLNQFSLSYAKSYKSQSRGTFFYPVCTPRLHAPFFGECFVFSLLFNVIMQFYEIIHLGSTFFSNLMIMEQHIFSNRRYIFKMVQLFHCHLSF